MAPHHDHSDLEGFLSHDSNDESDYHEHHTEARNATTRSSKAGSSSKKKPANSRRASHQADDSAAAHHDDSADPQNARKMQNRLAQREFRARRLEHIKELEARVEFLSKPQSEQTEILVAIIHGLMDENKQLRGALKTMAGFVSTGAGGLSHALHLPEYDDALDLVNRGDRALLLKLVQEKGALVGAGNQHPDSSQINHQHPHCSNTATNAHKDSSPPNSASTIGSRPQHLDKKRKSSQDTHAENSSSKSSGAKAPRTRSQNARGRQDTTTTSTATSNASSDNVNKGDWQHVTPRDTPPMPSSASKEHAYAQPANTHLYDNRPSSRNTGGASDMSPNQANQGRESHMMNMFPPAVGNSVGPLGSFDIFGDNTRNQSTGSNIPSNASSAFGPGASANANGMGVKQEDSPPLLPYQDPASAWMNAYTNLTPMGEVESFWSLNSSVMALQEANNMSGSSGAQQQQQQQQQQSKRNQQEISLDGQDDRNPSLAYNSNWSVPAQLLNNSNTFSAQQNMQQSMQQHRPLHGFA